MEDLSHRYFPCKKPVAYSIGAFDSDFGISKATFLESLKEAETIWEKPVGRNLFDFEEDGELKINLIYDYRQETTAKIQDKNQEVSAERASYDVLMAQYLEIKNIFSEMEMEYRLKVSAFEKKQNDYNQRVELWNSRGGAPQKTYDSMAQEEKELEAEIGEIRQMERELNKMVLDLNNRIDTINALARELNLSVAELENIDRERGEEFTQGEYRTTADGNEINVYEFSTKQKLVRLLAHEFGHALGILHVEDPGAIMYYLNENTNGALTQDDLLALKMRCKMD